MCCGVMFRNRSARNSIWHWTRSSDFLHFPQRIQAKRSRMDMHSNATETIGGSFQCKAFMRGWSLTIQVLQPAVKYSLELLSAVFNLNLFKFFKQVKWISYKFSSHFIHLFMILNRNDTNNKMYGKTEHS